VRFEVRTAVTVNIIVFLEMKSGRLPEMERCVSTSCPEDGSRMLSPKLCNFMILYDNTFQQTVILISLQFNNSARKTGGTRSLLKRIEAEASGQFDIPASLPPGKGPPYPFKRRQGENSRASAVILDNRNICASSLVTTLTTLSPFR